MNKSNSKIMKIWLQTAGITLSLFFMAASAYAAPHIDFTKNEFGKQIGRAIKERIETVNNGKGFICQGELLCGIDRMPSFYKARGFMPVWFDEQKRLDMAKNLADAVSSAKEDGLSPNDYHLEVINQLIENLNAPGASPQLWADLDLILTDAFLLFGSHLFAGRVNPETLHTDQVVNLPEISLIESLKRATRTRNIQQELTRLRPSHRGYVELRKALKRLRAIAANKGWPEIPGKEKLKRNVKSPLVSLLRARLRISQDLMPRLPEDTGLFDRELENAVRRYQLKNGLKSDGIVGKNTRAMLNVSVDDRIRQVEMNLERWRWLPHELGMRHIMVNTADFSLKMKKDDRTVLAMRVVAGRPARRSPVFSSVMSYMVLNPYWNVPTSIAIKDILPRLNENVSYLKDQAIKVFYGWKKDAPEMDPDAIDWLEYGRNRFPFRLRQEPGPKNALGRIKFMFPNKFAVYLHDTPNRSLFENIRRGFSSGCIRVEKPVELARMVLGKDRDWTKDKLVPMIDTGERKVIRIKHQVRVHLMYMTAWVDEWGDLQFREDIYDRDQVLNTALKRRIPYPKPSFKLHFKQKNLQSN